MALFPKMYAASSFFRYKVKFLLAVIFSLLFFSVSQPVLCASESDTLFQAGMEFFDRGKFEKAYDSFQKAFEAEPGNLDASFFLGRAAFEIGDYEMAIMAFDRVLILDPNANRVKLELARCHLKLNSSVAARQLFTEVLATNPPEPVRANIERYIKNIDEGERSQFINGFFALGVIWDDNVRISPVDDRIKTLAGDITLTGNTATPTKDLIYTTMLALDYNYRINTKGLTWKTTFINYNSLYNDEHDLDLFYFGLASGPSYKTTHFAINANATVNHIDFEHDRYLEAYGTDLSFNLFSELFSLNIGAKIDERNYVADPNKDSTYLQVTTGLTMTSGQNRLLTTYQRIVENAKEDYNSLARNVFILQYDHQILSDLSLALNWRHQDTKYDAASQVIQTWFGVIRNDRTNDYSANISYRLWKSTNLVNQINGNLKYAYTDNQSTIGLYSYKKNVVSLSFIYSF